LHFAASAPDPFLLNTVSVYSMNFKISYRECFNFLRPRLRTDAFERLKLPVTQLLATDPTSGFEADNDGSFPVHIAASAEGMVSLIVLLTRYPDCARLRNAEGKTFLHVAVEETRHGVVKFVCLLWGHRSQFRSVVNMQGHKGNTALHLAVLKGDLSMSRELIRNQHVHINLENEEGKTPMDLAAGAVKSGFYFGVVRITVDHVLGQNTHVILILPPFLFNCHRLV
jgi:ankyrin repeat protein